MLKGAAESCCAPQHAKLLPYLPRNLDHALRRAQHEVARPTYLELAALLTGDAAEPPRLRAKTRSCACGEGMTEHTDIILLRRRSLLRNPMWEAVRHQRAGPWVCPAASVRQTALPLCPEMLLELSRAQFPAVDATMHEAWYVPTRL